MHQSTFLSTSSSLSSLLTPPTFPLSIPNPLKLFPAKTNDFAKTFLINGVSKHMREIENRERWLHVDALDPTFGISGNSQEVEVRRAYRRIQSSSLFVAPKSDEVHLSDLYMGHQEEYSGRKPKNFVMVEESRLAELTKFENILRDEKVKLSEQCAMAIKDLQGIAPWIPLPATRYAIHNICESDMRRYAAETVKLSAIWGKYCRDNNYNRGLSHIFPKESYVNRAPVALRAVKLKVVKDSQAIWLQQRDRDTMMFEDDMSYFVDKYLDAQNRKRDYDRYYVLATRYNTFTEEKYYSALNPGQLYFGKVLDGATKFQRAWGPYWVKRRKLQMKSAILLQRQWRRYWCRKTIYPIIRIRRKIGFRTYLFWCWAQWKDYNFRVKAIKHQIYWKKWEWARMTWASWSSWSMAEVARKNRIKQKFIIGMKYKYVQLAIRAWYADTQKVKALKRRLRRTFQLPEFGTWCRFTEWRREIKRLNRSAAKIQSIARRNKWMKIWKMKKLALKKFREFLFITILHMQNGQESFAFSTKLLHSISIQSNVLYLLQSGN